MRKALNENPIVQLAVFGVAAVALAIILFSGALGGGGAGSAAESDQAAAPEATTPAPAAPAPTESAAPSPTAAPTTPAPASPAPSGASGSADGLLPTKGLPEDVLVAYARDKAIALLVVDPKQSVDKRVEAYTKRLEARDDVAVFTVSANDIIRYSRITEGVAVSRVPALVVVRPRKLTDGAPTATVAYGFRSPKSVEQQLDDALYDGKQIPAHP